MGSLVVLYLSLEYRFEATHQPCLPLCVLRDQLSVWHGVGAQRMFVE